MKSLSKMSIVLTLAFAILFSGCSKQGASKLSNEVINAGNLTEIITKIKDENTMAKEDIELLTNGIIRLGSVKDSIYGKKVGQIIDLQKEYIRKASFNSLYSSAAQIEMNLNLTIKFIQKLKLEKDTINADGIEFQMTNNTDKEIVGISGAIRLINDRNELFGVRPIKYDKMNLKPGAQFKQQEMWPHIATNPTHVAFRNEANITPVWVAETITYADGKVLSINPPQPAAKDAKDTKDAKDKK